LLESQIVPMGSLVTFSVSDLKEQEIGILSYPTLLQPKWPDSSA